MRSRLIAFALALGGTAFAIGCAGTQTVTFTSSEPAEIWAGRERICETTPCTYEYPRKGCGFPKLAATNRIGFEARTADGRSAHLMAADYCDVEDEWFYDLPTRPGFSQPDPG